MIVTLKHSKRYVYMISILPFLYLCHCRNSNFIPGLSIARETCSAILRFIDDQSSWNPGTCSIPSSVLGYCFGHKVLCIKNLHRVQVRRSTCCMLCRCIRIIDRYDVIWTLNLLSMLVDTVISFRSQMSASGDHNSDSNLDIANRAARCVDHWGHMCCTAGLESGLTTVIQFASNLSEMSQICCSSDIWFLCSLKDKFNKCSFRCWKFVMCCMVCVMIGWSGWLCIKLQ